MEISKDTLSKFAGDIETTSARVITSKLASFSFVQDSFGAMLYHEDRPMLHMGRTELVSLKILLDTFLARAEF